MTKLKDNLRTLRRRSKFGQPAQPEAIHPADPGAIPPVPSSFKPSPPLPSELLWEIVERLDASEQKVFLADCGGDTTVEVSFTQSHIHLTLVCKGWYQHLRPYFYRHVAPTKAVSCRLLVRTLQENPKLAASIQVLKFPCDVELITRNASGISQWWQGAEIGTIKQLVGLCTNVEDLRIPISRLSLQNKSHIQVNFPKIWQLEHLTSLEVVGRARAPMEALSDSSVINRWLSSKLVLPTLKHLTLSGVSIEGPVFWPQMPHLHSLKINRPTCASPSICNIPLLLQHIGPSLKALHIYCYFDSLLISRAGGCRGRMPPSDFVVVCRNAIRIVAPYIEELSISYSIHANPHFSSPTGEVSSYGGDISWKMDRLASLELPTFWFHLNFSSNPPPNITTLTLKVFHDADFSSLDFQALVAHLPSTLKNLIFKVEADAPTEAWHVLSLRFGHRPRTYFTIEDLTQFRGDFGTLERRKNKYCGTEEQLARISKFQAEVDDALLRRPDLSFRIVAESRKRLEPVTAWPY